MTKEEEGEVSEQKRERAMTPDERERWRIRDDQCPTLITSRIAFDSACLLPMPCLRHLHPHASPWVRRQLAKRRMGA